MPIVSILLALHQAPGPAAAQERVPKVALVLSGGGARGAAHIGVLEVFEREKIPIDFIVGTSFGALVGGLYSLGYSTAEIKNIFASDEWNGVFSNAPDRSLSPLLGAAAGRYQAELSFKGMVPKLPSGLLVGQRLTEILDRLTTDRMVAAGFDFDRLAYRFRAVTTNLVNGDRYVFRNGPMTEAIRAAIAIPLVFTPVEKDQMVLIDGGLVDNLPTDVAREMGADIVIAVDVTSPLLEKEQIKTFLQVMDQSISLFMRRNVEANRKLADMVVQPDLQKYGATDYSKFAEITQRGSEAAERQLPAVKALLAGVPPHGPQPVPVLPRPPMITSVSFEGLRDVRSGQLHREVRAEAGRPLDVNILEQDLRRLYATGLFERVDFKLVPERANGYHLIYTLQESAMRILGAAIRYDRDYGFVALTEFGARQVLHTPSTITFSSQFGGLENYFANFHYVPSYRRSFFYIAPEVHYSTREYREYSNGEVLDRFTYKQLGGQVMVGALFRRSEIEIGYRSDRATVAGGIPPSTQFGALQLRGLRLNFALNTSDAHRFPSRGTILFARADTRQQALGSDVTFSKSELEAEHYIPVSQRSNIEVSGAAGFSRGAVPFYERFYVGGYNFSRGAPLRLIGYAFGELPARQLGIVAAAYRYRWLEQPLGFTKHAFFSAIYNVAALSDQGQRPYHFRVFSGAGAELAFDTLIGPLRLAGGWGQGGRFNLYLTFGPTF